MTNSLELKKQRFGKLGIQFRLVFFRILKRKYVEALKLSTFYVKIMSSSEIFPTSVANALTGDVSSASSLQNIGKQSNSKIQKQISRPKSKMTKTRNQPIPSQYRNAQSQLRTHHNSSFQSSARSNNSRQKSSERPKSNLNGNYQLYSPPISPSIRATRKCKILQRTYEAINNPNSLPYNIDELKTIIYQLQILQQRHTESAEYPEAEHIQRVIRSAEKKLKNEEERKNNQTDVKGTVYKRQELQAIVDIFVDDWNQHYEFFIQTTKKEARELKQQHQNELDAFDASQPQNLPPKFRKRSVNLIKMRDKERALALNKQFLAAEHMKNIADEAEAEETQKSIKAMQDDFHRRRELLLNKQKEQLRVFCNHSEMTRIKMIQQRDQLLDGYVRRLQKLDSEIENLTENGKMTKNEISSIELPQIREKAVTDKEYSFPIPRIRPGTSFLNARNGITTPKPPDRSKQLNSDVIDDDYENTDCNLNDEIVENDLIVPKLPLFNPNKSIEDEEVVLIE